MNSDESSRGMSNYMNRKQNPPKYGDKNHMYSPSSNFNYGNSSYNGNSSFNGQQQRTHRRPGYKRDNFNSNDRLIKQNDIIIRLLKEIRDRLPPPPMSEDDYEENIQDQRNDLTDIHDAVEDEDDAVVMEPADENYSDSEHDSYPEDDDNH